MILPKKIVWFQVGFIGHIIKWSITFCNLKWLNNVIVPSETKIFARMNFVIYKYLREDHFRSIFQWKTCENFLISEKTAFQFQESYRRSISHFNWPDFGIIICHMKFKCHTTIFVVPYTIRLFDHLNWSLLNHLRLPLNMINHFIMSPIKPTLNQTSFFWRLFYYDDVVFPTQKLDLKLVV